MPPRDSNPDMLIQSPSAKIEGDEAEGLGSPESNQVPQDPANQTQMKGADAINTDNPDP